MIQRLRQVERFELATYAGDPPGIRRYFILEPSSPGAHGIARLLSSDLRSLSRVFEQSRDGSSVGLHVVAFGQDRQGAALPHTEAASAASGYTLVPPGFLPSGSYWLGGDVVAANSEAAAFALGLHRVAWDHITYRYGFDSSVHTGLCTHPDGHFAVFAHYKNPYDSSAPVVPFDLIEYRRVFYTAQGDRVERFDQTTHLAALRATFSQAFDRDGWLTEFLAAITSDKPIVVQRFAAWRNIKMPKVSPGSGTFGMNPRLGPP